VRFKRGRKPDLNHERVLRQTFRAPQ